MLDGVVYYLVHVLVRFQYSCKSYRHFGIGSVCYCCRDSRVVGNIQFFQEFWIYMIDWKLDGSWRDQIYHVGFFFSIGVTCAFFIWAGTLPEMRERSIICLYNGESSVVSLFRSIKGIGSSMHIDFTERRRLLMDAMEGVLKESSEYDGVNRDGNVGLGSEFIILIILLLK